MTAWQRRVPLALIACALLGWAWLNLGAGTPSAAGRPAVLPSTTPWPATSFSEPTPRLAIVYDLGGRGTAGFSELAWEGAKRAADSFGADLLEVTAKPGETDADREERLKELADARYDPIFVIGSANASAVAKVAPKYPKIWFGTLDNGTVDARNVIGIQFNEEQGSFLAGAAAALTSKTGKVGFIGGVKTSLLLKYEAGFTAGARAASPQVKVEVAYLSQALAGTGSTDPVQARRIALGMYDAGADVIFATAGDAGGVIQAAHERGRWAIGANSDQYLASDPSVRGAVLTSMLKRADLATYATAMEVANGIPKDGNNVFDLDRGGVGYSTSGGFVDSIKAQLDAFAARIASGEILVPTKP